jgi:hypothetical protein
MPIDEDAALSARARRTLAKHAAQIQRWHDAIPLAERRPFYTSVTIAAGTRLDPSRLGPALRALGWQRAQRRLPERQGLPTSVWAPPSAPSPRRAPGRPRSAAGGKS